MRRRSIDDELEETTPLLATQSIIPKDAYRLVFLSFYYIGVSILLPYSMIITLSEFWMYKFRNITDTDNVFPGNETLTDLQKAVPGYLSLSGNVPTAVFTVLTTLFGGRLRLKTRLLVTGCLKIVAFCVFTLIAGLNTDNCQDFLLVAVLLTNTCFSIANSIFQTSFLGNIGKFPPRYIGSANDGIGLGASLPPIFSIVILALNPPPQYAGLACISFVLVILALMVPIYSKTSQTEFYKHYSGSESSGNSSNFSDYLVAFKSSWIFIVIIFYNFTLTLSIYPAVAALVKPMSTSGSDWNTKYFVVVCCFLLQSVCDWMGRSVASFSQWPKPGTTGEVILSLAVLLRTAFLPLIMMCNIAPLNRSTTILLGSDYAYIGLMVGFSLIGGYIGNSCLMLGPKKVEGTTQELVGNLLITSLVLGLGTGSLLGPVLVSLL